MYNCSSPCTCYIYTPAPSFPPSLLGTPTPIAILPLSLPSTAYDGCLRTTTPSTPMPASAGLSSSSFTPIWKQPSPALGHTTISL